MQAQPCYTEPKSRERQPELVQMLFSPQCALVCGSSLLALTPHTSVQKGGRKLSQRRKGNSLALKGTFRGFHVTPLFSSHWSNVVVGILDAPPKAHVFKAWSPNNGATRKQEAEPKGRNLGHLECALEWLSLLPGLHKVSSLPLPHSPSMYSFHDAPCCHKHKPKQPQSESSEATSPSKSQVFCHSHRKVTNTRS